MWAVFVGAGLGAIWGGEYGAAAFMIVIGALVWALDAVTRDDFGA